jgi:hydroxyacylglutathione hydrolase
MAAGDLDVRWIHGDPDEPLIQVHRYDEHTHILRQSKAIHYEAPFLYLLFGNDRALLLDTGATEDATSFPLRKTVDDLVKAWLAGHPRDAYELVVAHTHAHGDHIAGDGQFADRPRTTVVGTDLDSVRTYFGFTEWPDQIVTYDLGGRTLEITGIPGHHPTSVAMFDPWTGFLLTGDTVLPGRLIGNDMPAFVRSMDHLLDFATARPVTYVMGCHIEMSRTPGHLYPVGTTYQPDEPPLQLTMAQLRAIRDATHQAATTPGFHVFDEFVIDHRTT